MSVELVMPSNHLTLCCPLLLPSIFPSIRVFSIESVLRIRWPKYWSFSFSISPSTEYSGLISFRIDWFDLLVVQGVLKNLLQCHSLKASILWHSAFFILQLSHPYMTTGKTIALTIQTFIGKVMSLLFNMLSSSSWAAKQALGKAALGALCLTKSSACGRLWQFAHPRPLSLLQRGLAPRSKGKAREGLRPARRQARLPHSRSLLLPGRER